MKPAETARLFARWQGARGILLAVSGGPDSMALLHLAAQWAKAVGGPKLFAATVDHRLRAAAAAEADLAAAAAKHLAIPHRTLIWEGKKPATGIQEKARAARYTLLSAEAKDRGADVVMTAHHADDQAETILFRLLRGSGLTGLAAMREQSALDHGLILARPLLSLRKQQLVKICRTAGQAFAEDPSNSDPHYSRTAIRAFLAGLEGQDFGAPDWTRLARRLGRADEALAQAAGQAAERAALASGNGGVSLSLAALSDDPEEIVLRVLAMAMERAGAKLPLRLEKLEALLTPLIAAARERGTHAATLAGLQLRLDRKGKLTLAPEPPRKARME